jgi:hypothetical protein
MTEERCAKCGSDRVISAARLVDRGHYSGDAGNVRVRVDADPSAWVRKGKVEIDLAPKICGRCGYTELYATDPEMLWGAYVASLDKR